MVEQALQPLLLATDSAPDRQQSHSKANLQLPVHMEWRFQQQQDLDMFTSIVLRASHSTAGVLSWQSILKHETVLLMIHTAADTVSGHHASVTSRVQLSLTAMKRVMACFQP